jgi:hypothetical protein
MRSPGRVARALARRLAPIGAVALVAGLASACSTTSLTTSDLPTLSPRCSAPVTSTSAQAIPFAKVSTGAGPLVMVAVCLDGHGPYPFAVATGMGGSVISPTLKHELGVASAASGTIAVRGPTCVSTAPTVAISKLTLGGVALQPQDMLVGTVPDDGASLAPLGLIGSDVLARFGAVRFDYAKKVMTVARPESATPLANTVVIGQANATPPAAFVKAGPKADAVLSVVESPTATLISVAATFGPTKAQLLVDSGSPRSIVSQSVATAAGLSSASGSAAASGIGCSGTKARVSSGTWSARTSALPATTLLTESFAGAADQGLDGAIGADVLASYGSFIVDYGGAHLWLGVG